MVRPEYLLTVDNFRVMDDDAHYKYALPLLELLDIDDMVFDFPLYASGLPWGGKALDFDGILSKD